MNAFTDPRADRVLRAGARHAARARASTSSPTSCGSPAFRADDVESERQVILEEIGMRDDTPDDLVHDLFEQAHVPRASARARGARQRGSIEAMTRDEIAAYHGAHYQPVEHRVRGGRQPRPRRCARAGRARGSRRRRPAAARARASRRSRRPEPLAVVHRPTEQAHVVLGMRALPALDPDRYALTVLNQALGGGMSSRLFQEVREERGLAYSVYSYRAAYDDAGFLAIYAGTAPDRVARDARRHRDASSTGSSPTASRRASSTPRRATSPARWRCRSRRRRAACAASAAAEQVEGDVPTLDELVARVVAVTADDVERVIDRVLARRAPHARRRRAARTRRLRRRSTLA